MRIVLGILGGLLVFSGGVFILQGINIIPGSFMTGQMKWAVYGAIMLVAGVGLLVRSRADHQP